MLPPFPPEQLEALARAIHDGYRNEQSERHEPGDAVMADWDDLAEHLRASSRSQALDIPRKLSLIGWEIVPMDEPDAEPVVFSDAEIERLAVLEHERWVAERRAAGWTAGSTRDAQRKVTPYLVDWDELSAEAQEWDRAPVRRIPELIAGVGLAGRRVRAGSPAATT